MKEPLPHIVQEIKDQFQTSPFIASRKTMELAESYPVSTELENQAILLNLQLSQAGNDSARAEAIAKLKALIDQIVSDYQANMNSEAFLKEAKETEKLAAFFRKKQAPKAIVCQTNQLKKTFRGRKTSPDFVLENVSITLRQGEITSVVGENGNGKTTLFRLIVGELSPDSGDLSFPYLLPGSKRVNWHEVKRQTAYVPQELPPWYGNLRENLEYEAAIHGLTGKKNKRAVDYIVERLALTIHQDKKWRELSGGYKLRFALARALVWKPKLLVIDEPLANLDIKAQLIILNDLRDLASSLRFPMAVLISSQHLHEIEQISDHILFLKKGKADFYGPVEKIGADRAYNTFELDVSLERTELRDILQDFPYRQLDHNGLAYMITTPLDVDDQQLLNYLINQGIRIEYFRDISRSAKKLIL